MSDAPDWHQVTPTQWLYGRVGEKAMREVMRELQPLYPDRPFKVTGDGHDGATYHATFAEAKQAALDTLASS